MEQITVYEKKLHKIRNIVYANESQIASVIGIRNQIKTHYDVDLNLDVLSREHLISKYHLLRLFKKYFGQTPRQYLIDTRIEKSKEHLANGLSVSETCFSVGFESLGTFSTLFKRRTGKSPSEFQKEQLSRSKTV